MKGIVELTLRRCSEHEQSWNDGRVVGTLGGYLRYGELCWAMCYEPWCALWCNTDIAQVGIVLHVLMSCLTVL